MHHIKQKIKGHDEGKREDRERKGLSFWKTSDARDDEEDPFPSMAGLKVETVQKRYYNWPQKLWEKDSLQVKIMPDKFAEGGMRAAHFMILIHPDGREERLVAKRQKDGTSGPEMYDTDVVMQAACQAVADAFNARNPAKKVRFVECYVIQRADASWWSVETYIRGKYRKYNNNYGFVGKDARNTPQAFSHFSYEYTEGKLMIVDIQGVDDLYTDPQVHTIDGKGFGQGNLGVRGMERFMKTHWCNPICGYLGLEFHTPKRFGVTWHKNPKRDGTTISGETQGGDNMKMADFIGELKPKKGSATPEDLALLGLSERQFNALASAFNEMDRDKTGFLTKQELCTLFQKARVGESKTKEAEEFGNFVARLESQVNAQGKVSFKSFILCWTDNL